MNLDDYLAKYFPKLELKQPVFYNWDYGLRFGLGYLNPWIDENRTITNKKYFQSALNRANSLYECIFDMDDDVFVVCQRYSDGRQKIKKQSFCYKGIQSYSYIESFKIKDPYYEKEDVCTKQEHWQRKIFYTKNKYINHKKFLYRSVHYDFAYAGVEVYFINVTKNVILYNYDDRGLDIISHKPETLQSLYNTHNDWILDYDKERIDKIFNKL